DKPQAVVGTKLDVAGDKKRLNSLAEYCRQEALDFFPVSAATRKGLKKLLSYLAVRMTSESMSVCSSRVKKETISPASPK
ncbi:MAG: hypothetical protein HZA17_09675, partial [Nitrospirae bacterium]|nr:hypothetical protein [Nitrospirota bacterium]